MGRFIFGILAIALFSWPVIGQARPLQSVTLPDGRFYLIAVPEGVSKAPLILALHGGGGWPAEAERSFGLTDAALKAGYAVAYPAGTSRRGGTRLLVWNALYCCGYAPRAQVDDVAYLARVIADAGQRFGVDTHAVYLTGMSNGAMMAQTYATLHPQGVRALATVSGSMDTAQLHPATPIPFLDIHGTADDHVPYTGGHGAHALSNADYSSVAQVLQAFQRPFGPLHAISDRIDPTDDGMSVERTRWQDGQGITEVEHLKIIGGGHTWPGGVRAASHGGTQDIGAATEVLDFFNQHRG